MFAVADTEALVADGVLSPAQAREIETRARETMMRLAVDVLLVGGVLAAAGGLGAWLRDPGAIAVAGAPFALLGFALLLGGRESLRFFGAAAALIGAAMLMGGAMAELGARMRGDAWRAFLLLGAVAGLGGWAAWRARRPGFAFTGGAILLMGVAVHAAGAAMGLDEAAPSRAASAAGKLYLAALLAWAGWRVNVRLVTALSIIPFAMLLDAGRGFGHVLSAVYVPEHALRILQMGVLAALAAFFARRTQERHARHLRMMAMMGFLALNLSALAGSLAGDDVGESLARAWYRDAANRGGQSFAEAMQVWREGALHISAEAFAVAWALGLCAVVLLATLRNDRGLFNAGLSFAGIHFFVQLFAQLDWRPQAFAIAGLAAIPLAWGARKANRALAARDRAQAAGQGAGGRAAGTAAGGPGEGPASGPGEGTGEGVESGSGGGGPEAR